MQRLKPALFLSLMMAWTLPAEAQMAKACFADCQAMQAERDALFNTANSSAATSGATTKEIDALDDAIKACNTRCTELDRIQDEYIDCINRVREAAADEKINLTPEQIEFETKSCRTDYRFNKDKFHKEY